MLAGLPQSPSTYNPFAHDASATVNPLAKQRQQEVLSAMVSVGDISQAQADNAYNEKLTFHLWTDSEPNIAPTFVSYLHGYLDNTFGDAYIKPGGWEIHTTLNLGAQTTADSSVGGGVAAVHDKNAHDGALVSLDPRTGGIKAMTGTWNYADPGVGQLNMAIRDIRPGSTIKLFTYTAAIASRKYTMTSPILDAPVTLADGSTTGYTPLNYDRRFHGVCPLEKCLGNSFNVPAVKTEVDLGIPYITNLEIAAGINSLNDPTNKPGPKQYSATLGGLTYGITPLELADGAATIADMGVQHDPAPITEIVDSTKTVIYQYNPDKVARRVIPEDVAFIMSEITSNDNNRLVEFGPKGDLTLPNRRVSAKTGTTDFFEDNWTVGWTPQLVTTVWVGNPTPSCLRPQDRNTMAADMTHHILYGGQTIDDPFSPGDLAAYGLQPINDHCGHLEGSTGITGAAPIWNQFMKTALAGAPAVWYPKPADVIGPSNNDDGSFYLPGQSTNGQGQNCYYYAPQPNPSSTCDYYGPYNGQSLGPATPKPSPTPG